MSACPAPFLLKTAAMNYRRFSEHRLSTGRRGFTMIEMILVFTIVGLMLVMTIPRIQRNMISHQTRRAATQVAGDVEQAFTLAARYRKPMRLSCTCGTATYTIADRTGGTVRLSRDLRNGGDLGTMTLAFTVSPLDIFPSGVSTSLDTITVSSGGSTRRVVVTSAGQVRIIP
jgi:prepilin-type N-terminal cleavage/methylation domain-containing protein